jgi:predicted amidophosphoribosyltransferase
VALVPCPECRRRVSDRAVVCSGCGNPLAEARKHVCQDRIEPYEPSRTCPQDFSKSFRLQPVRNTLLLPNGTPDT